MDKKVLVEKDIIDGRQLVDVLIKKGFIIKSALWLYDNESRNWELVIASPHFDKYGPKETYLYIGSVIDELQPKPDFSIVNISAVSSENNLIKKLEQAFKVKDSKTGVRFSSNYIFGEHIDDALIYRSGSAN